MNFVFIHCYIHRNFKCLAPKPNYHFQKESGPQEAEVEERCSRKEVKMTSQDILNDPFRHSSVFTERACL